MLYDYILKNCEKDEPIFLSELPGDSRDYVRQEMKKLVDDGKLERLFNGVYYLSYTTILGTKGKMSIDKYVDKKFIKSNGRVTGYITGIQLANMYGFTTQTPACIEVCSNITEITKENQTALQFLELMTTIDKYSEISGNLLRMKLKEFVNILNVDFSIVKRYIALFPDRVYRNIYQGELMGELV